MLNTDPERCLAYSVVIIILKMVLIILNNYLHRFSATVEVCTQAKVKHDVKQLKNPFVNVFCRITLNK